MTTADEVFERERTGIGDGWQPIIERLHAGLKEVAPDYEITQIKEKFGGLRYYIGPVHEDLFETAHDMIEAAERESVRTCEECGQPGEVQLVTDYWMKCVCPDHLERLRVERRKRDAEIKANYEARVAARRMAERTDE